MTVSCWGSNNHNHLWQPECYIIPVAHFPACNFQLLMKAIKMTILSDFNNDTAATVTTCQWLVGGLLSNMVKLYPSMDKELYPLSMWDEITCPSSNFNGVAIEVWEWISKFILRYTGHMHDYLCWNCSQSMLVKGPWWDEISGSLSSCPRSRWQSTVASGVTELIHQSLDLVIHCKSYR